MRISFFLLVWSRLLVTRQPIPCKMAPYCTPQEFDRATATVTKDPKAKGKSSTDADRRKREPLINMALVVSALSMLATTSVHPCACLHKCPLMRLSVQHTNSPHPVTAAAWPANLLLPQTGAATQRTP